MNNRTIVYSLGIIFLLSLFGASTASAQYFENAEPAYLPTKSNQKDLTLSRAGSESGFNTQGPPPLRFGFAVDFGAGGLRHNKMDTDFFAANGAPQFGGVTSLAWDVTLYLQLRDTVRVGLNVGQTIGSKSYRDAQLLHGGLNLEVGQRFYTGWGVWVGADVGYGRGVLTSAFGGGSDYVEYEYIGRGIGIRGFVRLEFEVAPFITLRLTPFVETLVRTSENFGEDVPASRAPMVVPPNSRGNFLGYGGMLGIAFHSF